MQHTYSEWNEESQAALVESLSVEKRLRGLSPEELLRGLSVEDRLRGLSLAERLRGLSPQERVQALLRVLTAEEFVACLSEEQAEGLRQLLKERKAGN